MVMNDRNQKTRVTSDSKTLVDLIITRKPEIIKGAVKTTEMGISDHKLKTLRKAQYLGDPICGPNIGI